MNELNQAARIFAHTFLEFEKAKGPITSDVIQEVVERVSVIDIVKGQSFDKQALLDLLIADYSIGKGEITALSEDIEPWVNDTRAQISPDLWSRYKAFMKQNDPSFPIDDLDDFTDKILDKCVNPKKNGSWDRRGMVVGHVQSGKTSNYVGLINKAVDAGYKLIIVIAGTMNSLRRQTQERIDTGFIGRNSSDYINKRQDIKIGVGKWNVDTDIYSFTSSSIGNNGDFSQSIATKLNIPLGKNPVILVIKKNKGILENLIDWLSVNEKTREVDDQIKLFDVPTLIIDDEADSASINASKSLDDVKTINRLLRTLLNIFDQNTFIGYTATPYANLFIPQEWRESLTTLVKGKTYYIGEDLFPRDFIINIKAPQNYIGAAKIFGLENPSTGISTEPLSVFRVVDDFDPPFFKHLNKHNKDNLPDYLPNSLKVAVKSFLLTCAIRRLRGHEKKHNSMLIHVALYVAWIDQVANLVNQTLKTYKNYINGSDPDFIEDLRILYETDYSQTTSGILSSLDYIDSKIENHSWLDVKKELKNAVSKIEVRAVHGTKSTTNLQYHNIEEIDYNRYENGFSVIAVGGSRLARGITLEGLSVSYYLRTTKMYDSLMQMGRWFGYRPGYVDLCRLFTTDEIYSWFNHITMATEEMRNDFDEMTVLLQRPKDFRLKVRNHHGLLSITSVAKLYWAKEMKISFSGQNLQTYELSKSEHNIKANFNAFNKLITRIGFPSVNDRKNVNTKVKYLIYRNTDVESICEFLNSYKIHQPSIKNATLSEYIKTQFNSGGIKNWNLCIVSNTDQRIFIDHIGGTPRNQRKENEDANKFYIEFEGEKILLGCTVRNQQERRDSDSYKISKNQIDDIKDRQVDLDVQNNSSLEIKKQREREKKGLILIYPLDERGAPNVNSGVPIIGFSIYFPKIEGEVLVSYTSSMEDDLIDNMMDDDDSEE